MAAHSEKKMFRKRLSQVLKILANYVGSYGSVKGASRFLYDLLRWMSLKKGRIIRVQSAFERPLYIRARSSDFLVYDEVVLRKCYSLDGYPQRDALHERYAKILREGFVPLIIDAGANVGFASVMFNEEFPESAVISIEPAEENISVAEMNLSGRKNVTIIKKCLWHQNSNLVLENAAAESFSFRYIEGGHKDREIASVTIDGIIAGRPNSKLFILKIDIEGAESEVLSAHGNWWNADPTLMIEPHDWLGLGRHSLRGALRRTAYQDSDIIVKGDVVMFMPLSSEVTIAKDRH